MLILTTLEQRKVAEEKAQREQAVLMILTEIREIIVPVKKMDDSEVQLNTFSKIMPKINSVLSEVTDKDSPWSMYLLGEILEVAIQFPEQTFLETLRIKICEIFYCSSKKPFPQEVLDQSIQREFGEPVRTLGYYWIKIQAALQDQVVICIPENYCPQVSSEPVTAKIINRTFVDGAVDDTAGADADTVLVLTDQERAGTGSGADVIPIAQRHEAASR